MDNKDRQIAYLNATTAAATLLGGTGAGIQELNELRDQIYVDGVEYIAGIIVTEAFPGAVPVDSTPPAGPGPVATVTPIGTPAAQLAEAVAGPGPAPIPGASPAGSDKEPLWQDLFNNYGSWYDNRADKVSGKGSAKSPDFRRKADKVALWINSRDTPQWVHQKLAAG